MTPITPKTSNVRRHAMAEMSIATSSGVKAPLTRVASQTSACARSRSFTGSQVASTRVRLGNAPASPAPKSARVTTSDDGFHDPAGRGGEERPPDDDPHEHAARADAVSQPPPGISKSA